MPLRPRGLEAPGAGFEPASHGVTVARRTDSTIPERRRRQQDSNLRTGVNRLRASNALPCRLGHASRGGRRGSRTPKATRTHPFSRRGTAPVAVLPVTPAGIEPALPRVRAGSSPLSYGVSVAGRSRTCTAPRFKRALFLLELRPRDGRGWSRTSGLLFVRQSALNQLSYSPETGGQGWSRTSVLFRIREALATELPAH